MIIEFCKYQGCGNDFIILDNRSNHFDNLIQKDIEWLCNRRFGVGADGLMLLNKKEGVDFEMKYFNADGSESTMCGNGGRCITKYFYDLGFHKFTYQFWAIDGMHEAEINGDDNIRLKMKNVSQINYQDRDIILDTGSPHYVKHVNTLEDVNVTELGRAIRNSKEFKEKGINVNFVEIMDDDSIFVRTYERGVEAETLSCGTGVTAAALISAHNERGFNRVEVKTLGGKLSVEFNKCSDTEFNEIWLIGPAKFVFKGEVEIKTT
jgi:diaminopimelate epimerase